MIAKRSTAPWLCICPLLAVASNWPIALTLATCLLTAIALAACSLAALLRFGQSAPHLPLAALVSGTPAVLEHLTLATWRPTLDAAVAPWLVLVAGLAALVCCFDESLHDDRFGLTLRARFVRSMKTGTALSAVLLVVGVARDGIGRLFLLAETPVGALALLALLLAGINFVSRASVGASLLPTSLPLDSSLRRNDERGEGNI
ncbi:MAG TPA: hypothetical protein VGK80_07840 [Rhodanobacteraceae bacterium]